MSARCDALTCAAAFELSGRGDSPLPLGGLVRARGVPAATRSDDLRGDDAGREARTRLGRSALRGPLGVGRRAGSRVTPVRGGGERAPRPLVAPRFRASFDA
jgi:hypothetical protein